MKERPPMCKSSRLASILSLLSVCVLLACERSPTEASLTSPGDEEARQNQPPSPAALEPEPVEERAAVVNGEVLTRAKFLEYFEHQVSAYRLNRRALPEERISSFASAAMRRAVDQLLIDQSLSALTEEEKSTLVPVSAFELRWEEELRRFGSQEKLEISLRARHKSVDDARAELRRELLLEELLKGRGLFVLRDEDLRTFYEERRESEYQLREQVRARHILVRIPRGASDEQIQERFERAQQLSREARRAPERFEELAQRHSEDHTRRRGGDLGFFPRRGLPVISPAFEAAVAALEIGGISEPVEGPEGLHLVKLLRRRGDRVQVSHLMLRFPQRKTRRKVEALRQRLLEIRAQAMAPAARFRLIARELSEAPDRHRGGVLSAFKLGGEPKFSAAFEEAAFTLSVGQVSAPLRSPTGWHILKVEEHQEARLQSFEEVKEQIVRRLRTTYRNRAIARFAHQLRREATIEYLIDTAAMRSDPTPPPSAAPSVTPAAAPAAAPAAPPSSPSSETGSPARETSAPAASAAGQ